MLETAHVPEPAGNEKRNRVRIAAAVVLYRCEAQASASIRTLQQAQTAAAAECDLHVIAFDNSAGQFHAGPVPAGVHYVAAAGNPGLANAYNRAIEIAEAEGYGWLLTLDQDTDLPTTFLRDLTEWIRRVDGTPEIAAVVPQIVAKDRIVSPSYFEKGAFPRFFPRGYTGVARGATFAFNSAAALRVSALRQAGGYDPYFWLDVSDLTIFRRLHLLGKRVCVAGNIRVEHDFSLLNFSEKVSPFRYHHILLAETAFWAAEMNRLAGAERMVRLAARLLVRQRGKASTEEMRRLTRQSLWKRLTTSRARRIAEFRAAVEEHLGPALASTALRPRPPKISVCMAAYNSVRYVERQIATILPQLGPHDELVIVDDGSTDGTPDRIATVNDPRLLLIRRARNQGLIATFEEAIRNATGDVLFLSDNDDLWPLDKVARFMREFERHPDADIVTSAVSLIDSDDRPLAESRYDRGGVFKQGFFNNVLRNYYQGSAMAFRSGLLRHVLPFPRNQVFLHDAWIGTVAQRLGRRTVFISEPLLLYRRHPGNFSAMHGWRKRIQLRLQLLLQNLRCALRGAS